METFSKYLFCYWLDRLIGINHLSVIFLLTALGAGLYAVYLGWSSSRFEVLPPDESKRQKAKFLIGFAALMIILFFLTPPFTAWCSDMLTI